ncbi:tRNA pseudouridine(38/39) synthase [Schistosoma japonicum]|nr:tRNA pseudouridine(38/39) synthase [Schistosoma japonicum]
MRGTAEGLKMLESKLQSLKELDFEALREKAISLVKQNQRLENLVLKLRNPEKNISKTNRHFIFDKYKKRHIALKLSYLGWQYCGLVPQGCYTLTVMDRLLDALEKAKLIENRNECSFSVCGRTDKGVSGICQVVSFVSRSVVAKGVGVIEDSGCRISERQEVPDKEMDFVSILNRNLPCDIRVLAWSPVSLEFNARFDCRRRSYEYYFPESGLDIESMIDAGNRLVGVHDFRNFCASRIEKDTVSFVREIFEVVINVVDWSDHHTKLYCLCVSASGFLYHQIRYIASILFMVGRGYESPSVIDDMLDLTKTPAKPQYQLAADYPLLFITGSYPEDCLNWETSEAAQLDLVKHYQRQWSEYRIRSAIVKRILNYVESTIPNSSLLNHHLDKISPEARFTSPLQPSNKSVIRKLSTRHVELTLDEKIEKIRKKRKISTPNLISQ